jgi:hypothetical protein
MDEEYAKGTGRSMQTMEAWRHIPRDGTLLFTCVDCHSSLERQAWATAVMGELVYG